MQTFLKPDWTKLILLAILLLAIGIPCYQTPFELERIRPSGSDLPSAELLEGPRLSNPVLIFTAEQAAEAGLAPPPTGYAYRRLRERKGLWTPGAGAPSTLAFAEAVGYRFTWGLTLPWLAVFYLIAAGGLSAYRWVYGSPARRSRSARWGIWLVFAGWMWLKIFNLLPLQSGTPTNEWRLRILALISPTVSCALAAVALGIAGYRQGDKRAGILTAVLGSLTTLAVCFSAALALAFGLALSS